MQKVPRTSPTFEIIGLEHAERRPLRRATSRNSDHKGSVAITETISLFLRNAAVPQEPTQGPIFTGLTNSAHSLGIRGPAPNRSRSPSGSISKIEERKSGYSASKPIHNLSCISLLIAPPPIIPTPDSPP